MNRTEEYIYYNALFDLYGNLLNEREREIYHLFYEEDLSLQEIAEIRGISKSAVGSAITTLTKKLQEYEKKLGFLKQVQSLKEIVSKISDENLQEKILKILNHD